MFYDFPKYYEVAFSFREIKKETGFLIELINRYSDTEVRNLFEIGCGNAPHAGEIISAGYRYLGLDINPHMINYAHKKWAHFNPAPILLIEDMVRFELDFKVDFAFVMLGSLYLDNFEQMSSHFDSISRALNKGGLYFLDFCFQFDDPLSHKDSNRFTVEKDGIKIESDFDIKLLDKNKNIYEETWVINVNDRGMKQTFKTVERNKAILPKEFEEFISQRDDFEIVGWWKDWDLSRPLDGHHDLIRPITLVRRI